MKTYSDLRHTYNWTKATQNGHFRPYKVALYTALLSCLSLGAFGATIPQVSKVSCSKNSFNTSGTDACSAYLTRTASSQVNVSLSSNDPAVTVPSTAYVKRNKSTGGFTATIASVTTARTATITATAGGVSKTYAIQLTPAATTPTLSISATSLAFGSVAVNSSATQSLTVKSTGTAAVTVNSAGVSGQGFSVSGSAFPVTLNPGQAVTLQVKFSPTADGSVTGQVTISSNSSSNPTAAVSLNGTGTATAPTLSAFSCSSATMTGPGSVTCTPTLSGAAPTGGVAVTVSSSSTTVTVPSTVTVAAGATSAAFAATVSSFSTAQTVTLTATAGGVSKSFALQLSPSSPTLSINATSISFGTVAVNSQATQAVTLTSSGTAAVTVNSSTTTGTGFSVSGSSFPVTLNPGQTLTLSVQFAPTAAGSATGQLTIKSNSSTNPTANIALSGTGQAQAHEVDLNWNAPDSSQDPVVGYNIYRSPSGASSYSRVNSSQNASTTYADSTVASGQSYDYVVKSVDAAGAESAPSNATTVSVP